MIERLFEIISRTPSKPEQPFVGELPGAVQELKFTRMGLLDHAVQGIEVPTASLSEISPVVTPAEAIPTQKDTPNTSVDSKYDTEAKTSVEAEMSTKVNQAVSTGFAITKEESDQADLAAAARQAMTEQYSQTVHSTPVLPQD